MADYVREHGKYLKSPLTLSKCIDSLTKFWGERPCSDVRAEICRGYVEERNIKPSAVARELSVLSAALNHDWRAGRLKYAIPVWRPKFDNRKDRWLTRAEAAALLREARLGPDGAVYYRAREYLPLFILIGLYTGARPGAILELTWPQVDLERGLIDFHPKGEERTNKGRARIMIPKRLLRFLKYAKRYAGPEDHVIQENHRPFKSVKKTFGEACERAGLRDVTPHTLRHTAASWMTKRGVAFPVIARYLGHSDSRTTERIYAHHAPDYLKAAVDALDNRPITAPSSKERKKSKLKKRSKRKR